MKNKGIHYYRLETEPLEKLFAQTWEEANINYGNNDADGLMKYLFSTDNKPQYTSDNTRQICATVIQWLGSPVGQAFLQTVNNKINKTKQPKKLQHN